MLILFAGCLLLGGLVSFCMALIVMLGGPYPLVLALGGSGLASWAAAVRVGYAACVTPSLQQSAPPLPIWLGLTGVTLGTACLLLLRPLNMVFVEFGLGPVFETVVASFMAGSLALGALMGFRIRVNGQA